MENKLNILVGMLNEIGIDYNTRFSITTRTIISSGAEQEIEVSVYFENDQLKNKRILRFKSNKYSTYNVTALCDLVSINLLRYLMFSKDSKYDGLDLGENIPIEVFSAKTIFNRNGK